jgi:hypothetical protein
MWTRLRTVLTVSIALALPGIAAGGTAHASAGQHGRPPVGPALISPLGHPRLCWQAGGNGSAIGLAACDAAIQGQLWTFTGNGVVMNGNGYCLQNGGAGGSAQAQAGSLFLSFSGQCAGAASQTWTFSGVSNVIRNPAAGLCAGPQGGADIPGAVIVGLPCGRARSGDRWSFGTSRLTLSGPGRAASGRGRGGSAAVPGAAAAGARRDFTATVTVTNAAGAMTAYGAAVWLQQPQGLTVTALAGGGSLSGWACTVRALRCQGSLAGGLSGQITISGTVTGRPAAQAIMVRGAVTHTNLARRGVRPAVVPVHVSTVAAGGSLPGGGARSAPASSVAKFGLIIAIVLVVVGIALALLARRRPRPPAAHAAATPAYPVVPGSQDSPGPAAQDSGGRAAQDSGGRAGQDSAQPAAKDPAGRSARD